MVSLQTNVPALTATRLLNVTNNQLAKTTERLSSGLRVNRAADDPAGIFTIEGITGRIRGTQAAIGNIQQAQSVVQLADAGLSAISDALQRMKELTVAAANETLSTDQMNALSAEYAAVRTSIGTIVNGTIYGGSGGLVLLDGSVGANVTLQVGALTSALATLDFSTDYSAGTLVAQATITTQATAITAGGQIDTALTTVATGRSRLGAAISALDYLKTGQEIAVVANEESRSRIRDADVAAEVANLVRLQIMQQAGASALAAANFSPQFVLTLLQ